MSESLNSLRSILALQVTHHEINVHLTMNEIEREGMQGDGVSAQVFSLLAIYAIELD